MKTGLEQRIESSKPILLAEMSPPPNANAEQVRATARHYVGKVHALGVADNREAVHMSALAAAALVAAEGVEPILHVTTRDRNRIALAADGLGAAALGIRNVLCTTGTHQTLGTCRSARKVFDIDSIQLLQFYAGAAKDASLVGEERLDVSEPLCLGATASPNADPMELQLMRLAKAVTAGARFVITQPVFDMERFTRWWDEVTRRGLHEKTAIIASIQPLGDADYAKDYASSRPSPLIPQATVARMAAKSGKQLQRAEGLTIANETMQKLSAFKGLRGFAIRGDGDACLAIEFLDKSGLRT